jgi:two-component system OmpR family response regulator
MHDPVKILLCEDDENLGSLLAQYLKAKGYHVTLRPDGEQGLQAHRAEKFDLMLLDVMMPNLDGFSMAKEVRKRDQDIPIVFLTAKQMRADMLEGFRSGADDFITKPFSMEELLLRIAAVIRRVRGPEKPVEPTKVFHLGQAWSSTGASNCFQRATGDDRSLTTKETHLLHVLCEHMNGTLERHDALHAVWGESNHFNSRSMDVYIAKLRKYLARRNRALRS